MKGIDKQRSHYAKEAERYDRTIWSLGNRDNRNHAVKIARLAQALRVTPGASILEIGTGTGLHGRWMLDKHGIRYTGVDASLEMLGVARSRLPEPPLLAADAARLPFPDDAFDGAYCSATLHHMDRPWVVLREMIRVVKPGTRVALMEPNWKFPTNMVETAINPVEWNCFKISGPKLVRRLREAGMRDVGLERVLYTPPKPERWLPAFDRVDAAVAKVPGLRRLSIMLLATGTKPPQAGE